MITNFDLTLTWTDGAAATEVPAKPVMAFEDGALSITSAGADKIFYSDVENGTYAEYTEPVKYTEPGEYTVWAYGLNNVGDSEKSSLTFTVEKVEIPTPTGDSYEWVTTGDLVAGDQIVIINHANNLYAGGTYTSGNIPAKTYEAALLSTDKKFFTAPADAFVFTVEGEKGKYKFKCNNGYINFSTLASTSITSSSSNTYSFTPSDATDASKITYNNSRSLYFRDASKDVRAYTGSQSGCTLVNVYRLAVPRELTAPSAVEFSVANGAVLPWNANSVTLTSHDGMRIKYRIGTEGEFVTYTDPITFGAGTHTLTAYAENYDSEQTLQGPQSTVTFSVEEKILSNDAWALVTSSTTLYDGDQVVVVANGGTSYYAAGEIGINGNNRTAVANISVYDGIISDIKTATPFTLRKVEGGWQLWNGNLVTYNNAKSNYWKESPDTDITGSVVTIEIAETTSDANVNFGSITENRRIQFNKSSSIFNTYNTDTQMPVQLFRKVGKELGEMVFTPESGTTGDRLEVAITNPGDPAVIRYSVNGGTETLYTAPVVLDQEGEHTVHATATRRGQTVEGTATYTIKYSTPAEPVITPAGGAVSWRGTQVTIAPQTAGPKVMYRLADGEEMEYTAPFTVQPTADSPITVTAWAVRGEYKSAEVSATYTMTEPERVTYTRITDEAQIDDEGEYILVNAVNCAVVTALDTKAMNTEIADAASFGDNISTIALPADLVVAKITFKDMPQGIAMAINGTYIKGNSGATDVVSTATPVGLDITLTAQNNIAVANGNRNLGYDKDAGLVKFYASGLTLQLYHKSPAEVVDVTTIDAARKAIDAGKRARLAADMHILHAATVAGTDEYDIFFTDGTETAVITLPAKCAADVDNTSVVRGIVLDSEDITEDALIYFGTAAGHSRFVAPLADAKHDRRPTETAIHDLGDCSGMQHVMLRNVVCTAADEKFYAIAHTWDRGAETFASVRHNGVEELAEENNDGVAPLYDIEGFVSGEEFWATNVIPVPGGYLPMTPRLMANGQPVGETLKMDAPGYTQFSFDNEDYEALSVEIYYTKDGTDPATLLSTVTPVSDPAIFATIDAVDVMDSKLMAEAGNTYKPYSAEYFKTGADEWGTWELYAAGKLFKYDPDYPFAIAPFKLWGEVAKKTVTIKAVAVARPHTTSDSDVPTHFANVLAVDEDFLASLPMWHQKNPAAMRRISGTTVNTGYGDVMGVSGQFSDTTGLENLNADADGAAEYYDLRGIRINQPTRGITIVRQGHKVSKRVF